MIILAPGLDKTSSSNAEKKYLCSVTDERGGM